jgi:hypothetical protein
VLARYVDGSGWHGGWFPIGSYAFSSRAAPYSRGCVHELVLTTRGVYLRIIASPRIQGLERYFDRHKAIRAWKTWRFTGSENATAPPPDRASLFARSQAPRYLKMLAYRYMPSARSSKFCGCTFFRRLPRRPGGFRFCCSTRSTITVSLKLEKLRDPDSPAPQNYRDYIGG